MCVCVQPIQKMSDELKSYVRNHDLSGLPFVKELFEGYKISESYDPSEASVTCSQVPADPSQLSEDDAHSSSSSITEAEKLKPKSLDISSEIQQVKQSNEDVIQKDGSVKKTRRSVSKNSASSKPAPEVRGRGMQRKPSKPIKQESAEDDDKVKKQGKKKPARGEGDSNDQHRDNFLVS